MNRKVPVSLGNQLDPSKMSNNYENTKPYCHGKCTAFRKQKQLKAMSISGKSSGKVNPV